MNCTKSQSDDDKCTNINTEIAHLVLVCMAGPGFVVVSRKYSHPGVHGNMFVHGVFGVLHYQSLSCMTTDYSVAQAYTFTYYASRYLVLPCLMADLWRSKNRKILNTVHLLSGIVPFTMALTDAFDPGLILVIGNFSIACNILSLMFYSCQYSPLWGSFTAAAAISTYFGVDTQSYQKFLYPLGLAVIEYGVYKLLACDPGARRSSARR